MAKQDRAENDVSVYWLVLGAPLAFLLSFFVFSEWRSLASELYRSLLPDWSLDDSAEGPISDLVWTSGEYAGDTEIENYRWAISPVVESEGQDSFLYKRPSAKIQVSCGNDWEFVSVEFSRMPEIIGAQPIAGGFDRISANVEWDGQRQKIEFLQERGSRTMSFSDTEAAITHLTLAEIMLLTLEQEGDESARFEFPLTGSHAAINNMRSGCR